MRIIVCGGREISNMAAVAAGLDVLHAVRPISLLAHGGAPEPDERRAPRGADALAQRWALARGVASWAFPADWSQGRSAGPRRNAIMLSEVLPDLVLAFPGGRGTADMVARARRVGVEVIALEPLG